MSICKTLFKRSFGNLARPVIREIEMELGTRIGHNDLVSQQVLMQQYRLLAANSTARLPSLHEVGFRKCSQFEEGGILLYIFAFVLPLSRKCVESWAGNGNRLKSQNPWRWPTETHFR